MKEGCILLLLSCITVSRSFDKRETKLADNQLNSLKNICPNLWKSILDEKIERQVSDCQNPPSNVIKFREESLLAEACFLVQQMLEDICAEKDTWQLRVNMNESFLCPFNFSSTAFRSIDQNRRFINVQLLANEKICTVVCHDLGQPVKQCVVLLKVYNHYVNQTFNHLKPILHGHEKSNNSYLKNEFIPTSSKSEISTLPLAEGRDPTELKNVDSFKTIQTLAEIHKNREYNNISVRQNISKKISNSKLTSTRFKLPSNNQNITTEFGHQSFVEKDKSNTLRPDLEKNQVSTNNEDFYNEEGTEEFLKDQEKFTVNSKVQSQNSDNPLGQEIYGKKNKVTVMKKPEIHEPSNQNGVFFGDGFFQTEDSHFFFYFLMFSCALVLGYLVFHNKNKILAFALEGKNSRHGRRRPNPAKYRKLEVNLEEVIASNSHTAASNVIY